MEKGATCKYCSEPIIGRIDKLFCTPNCKSSFHYEKNRDNESNLYRVIDNQLKINRRLLKKYNKAGMTVISKTELIKEGFNPKYFTHYWKNKKGDIYLFCYEFGFLEKKDAHKSKYVLVQWQSYMG